MNTQTSEDRLQEVVDELDHLRNEIISPRAFLRVSEWLANPDRKSAVNSFTASIERQVAYLLEATVIPVINQSQHALALERLGSQHLEERCRSLEVQCLNLEQALRHLAENACASVDWRFAQSVLNGNDVETAIGASKESAAALESVAG